MDVQLLPWKFCLLIILMEPEFFPDYTKEEKLMAYGILGGIPRYLQAFDSRDSIILNIKRAILSNGVFLNDEPMMLLKMELREPNIYNSILEAIARGYNRLVEIADCIHEEKVNAVNIY